MPAFTSLSKLMKIFHNSSLSCLTSKDLSPFSADRSHNFTKIKVTKPLSTDCKSVGCGLSVSCAETSQLDFGIFCDPTLRTHPDFDLTLLHPLWEVYQINKSQLDFFPFAWQEYPQDLD